ncbi:MAG: response regulator [Alphaproteobacteria bacterium]|nr:response regulator [Alphaproteobacteria bacterium]MBV9693858.1 response regulator [Alphaproteobacteria bacterium]
MPLNQALAPHLPYLRRYARALTGSQERGDAAVRATLAALVAGKLSLDQDEAPRVAIYRAFQQNWSADPDQGAPDSSPLATPEARLKALSTPKRAAVLLTSVEAFSLEEAGFILGMSAKELEAAIVEAQDTIDKMLASRVLVIEDEPIIAMDLEALLVELGHDVVAKAATRDEAVAMARAKRPGLVLADINLGEGGSGIDAVSEILRSFDIPVIFVTAYPEKLLTGERPEPAYLIAKPFLPETVQATVGQALFFHPQTVRAA